jgi:hypothetical protein
MDTQTFVDAVIHSIVDENLAIYAKLFNSTEAATDEYWISAKRFFDSLSSADRQVLLRIMRQVAIDTVSTMFGILDGTSSLMGRFESFELKHNGTRLTGELQDAFIVAIEEAG